MRMGARDLGGEPALSAADVGEGLELAPREGGRDGARGRAAEARHRGEELLEPGGVPIEHPKEIGLAVAALVLRQPGLQRLGKVAPEAVEPRVHHLKHAAAISGLIAVEIELGLGRVGVAPIGKALQHAERDERVEEVAGAALVQSERLAQLRKAHRPARGKAGEQAELDRAQKRLRTPERAAELEDLIGRNGRHLRHGALLVRRGQ